jgi:hypothetical protein
VHKAHKEPTKIIDCSDLSMTEKSWPHRNARKVNHESRCEVPDCHGGGRLLSPRPIVTWRGSGISPPRGLRSTYSPGQAGFSPGF